MIILYETLAWEEDCTVQLAWQATMASSDHQRTDHKFAEDRELGAKRCCDAGVPQAKADVTAVLSDLDLFGGARDLLCGDGFEEDRKHRKALTC